MKNAISRTFPFVAAVAALATAAFVATNASAYEQFESGAGGGNCSACHTSFKGFGDLHSQHQTITGNNCSLCHVTPGDNPFIELDPVDDRGCVGCHGRLEDAGNDTVFGQPAPGVGAGLRQHHTNAGVTACGACHSDANPANYTPVGEDVLPPFYGTVAGIVPDDPCTDLLDNDGDLLVDADDPDCAGNLPPVADAGGPYTGTTAAAVAFDGTGSSDVDGSIVAYDWDFGDGSTGTGASPTHTYAAAGTFTVLLTVTDNGGAVDTSDATATISGSSNQAPVIDPGGPYVGAPNEVIHFDASKTFDPDGDSLVFMWIFEQGQPPAFGATATHTWAAPGNYIVRLTVLDGHPDPAPQPVDVPVEIVVTNLPPVVDPGGPYAGLAGDAIQFDASNTFDPDGDPLTYAWDFGDGGASTEVSPTHTYAGAGTYAATLTVSDGINEDVVVNVPVEVSDVPPPPVGNTWQVKAPFGYLADGFTITFEDFAGVLIADVVYADGRTALGIGMEWDGVIYWMDMTGSIFFGNVNHDAGTMSGIAFFRDGVSIWFGEQQ